MKVLSIHGYKSDPYNSLYDALRSNGITDIVAPVMDYDTTAPGILFAMLQRLYHEEQPDIVCGSSMGGYFSALLSATTGCRALLVNPCMTPYIILPRLGAKNEAFVRGYMQLSAHLAGLRNAYAILADQDELIESHDFTAFLLGEGHSIYVPGGHHRGSSLPLKELIRDYGETFFAQG